MPPFNNPNVDDTGFYVPFYANPVGPLQAEPFATSLRIEIQQASHPQNS